MKLIAIDCSARLCAASVYDADAGRELGREVLDLGKGHAEHLMGVIDAAMQAAGLGFSGLDAVAVSVGPGSFTGVRVAVSAARGLALALDIPAIGVNTLEALATEARALYEPRTVLAALDGGRGDLQAAVYDNAGMALFEPAVIQLDKAILLSTEYDAALAGTAARMIAEAIGDEAGPVGPVAATADIGTFARLAVDRQAGERPKPLYLREPDAKPQAGFILPRSR
ncbi:tRNA (adenosine(37)-N6)-threonylcarbamoyltransferase complex dimerization subunit type 1 TsaB [Pseudaminobacter salicylatoxidans]|uniref:tRNA (adenosine(37)-N6)-threonylcarbamoyltransferase complex dimerization subunit type 1 TsaB n=1 Tax=Pseudaminobacter salicylatoxidans TaxID=93369 RepID=UPI000312C451|nr:tRNA (adenosine(37)-N6)-threonylcarbamoyltransferase complex dimerization subunit type 1 TsaB [Pseudaminobacter salicylatoxidans]